MLSRNALRTIEQPPFRQTADSRSNVTAERTTCLEPVRNGIRSILVLQFRYIGDLVLLTPLLHNLRLREPHANIAVVCEEPFADILRGQPGIEIITCPRGSSVKSPMRRAGAWLRVARELRTRSFDVVID